VAEGVGDDVVPERYRYAVVPHIMVEDADAAIDFYARAFGAREDFRIAGPDGGVLHAEITIGRSVLMLGDGGGEGDGPFVAPSRLGGGTSAGLHVYVPEVDDLAKRAEAAGAEVLQPPKDMFHGDRTVILKDPFGHVWVFLAHFEDVSVEEVQRRATVVG
jgi:PhnB protein